MLLGPAGVGKTCLKRGLMSLPFDPRTNSTIVADVQSVKPAEASIQETAGRSVSLQWMTQIEGSRQWSEVTEEDEIQELAQLMVLVGQTGVTMGTTSHSPQQNAKSSLHLKRLQQLLESEIVQKAIEKAMEMKKCEVDELKCQPLLHLWDCGGQPVFLEVLPIFLTSRTMFLLLFNAAIDLKQPWESVYHKEGKKFLEGRVNSSTLEMMERWIALIYSHLFKRNHEGVDDPGYPRVIPIGTRGDELKKSGRNSEEVLREVEECFSSKAALHHVLKQPLIIDNTSSGKGAVKEDPGYQKIREEILDMTLSKLKKKTPIAWILFRKLLQLFAKRLNRANIISLSDAYSVGSLANVEPRDIPAVLSFYHELGVLLYYPHIEGLQEKVILNPKWFVECLGKVLTLPGATEEQFEDKGEWDLLRNKGILVQRLYTKVWEKCEGVVPDEFIELLVHFQLAVKVETEEYLYKQCKQFFIPAVLPYTSTSPSAAGENSIIKTAAPLCITFDSGFAIPGFFTRLSTAMLKVKDNSLPKLVLFFKDGIYHNQVTYEIESLPSHFVTITEHTNTIEINFSRFLKQSNMEIQRCCINLKSLCQASCEEVAKCLQSLHRNFTQAISSFKLRVACQAEECKDQEIHFLSSDPFEENIDGSIRTSVVCEMNKKRPRAITLEEALWYKSCKLPPPAPQAANASNTSVQANNPIHSGKIEENISVLSSLSPSNENTAVINNKAVFGRHPRSVPKPQITHVYRQLKRKSVDWYKIGRELGVDWEYREELRRDNSLTNADRLENVLIKWSQSECSDVSWDNIVDTLKELEFVDLAKEVIEYLLHNPEAIQKYGWKEKN